MYKSAALMIKKKRKMLKMDCRIFLYSHTGKLMVNIYQQVKFGKKKKRFCFLFWWLIFSKWRKTKYLKIQFITVRVIFLIKTTNQYPKGPIGPKHLYHPTDAIWSTHVIYIETEFKRILTLIFNNFQISKRLFIRVIEHCWGSDIV